MLIYESVCKSYGATRAVRGFSAQIPRGAITALVGRSGSGKSTLLRLTNRLAEADSGRIRFGSRDVTSLRGRALRDWRSECAMIFQQFHLIGRLDVLDNVLLGSLHRRPTWASLFKWFAAEDRARAQELLGELDLGEQANQPAATLSGGQQQRAAIARAFLQNPAVVLADEPVASLDPRNARVVMEALRKLSRAHHVTVLVSLHDVALAQAYCDRILGMADGELVFDGLPSQLTREEIARVYRDESPELCATA
jgi:phosphonate transport system ATP-binding protein